jgi:hypothetical protein
MSGKVCRPLASLPVSKSPSFTEVVVLILAAPLAESLIAEFASLLLPSAFLTGFFISGRLRQQIEHFLFVVGFEHRLHLRA